MEDRAAPNSGGPGSTPRRDNAVLTDWLDLPITRGKKIAVVQTEEGGKKEAVTLKQLYELVLKESDREGTRRGGRDKQVLPELEEQQLELQRMGGGSLNVVKEHKAFRLPVGGAWKKDKPGDIVYGIYCRPGQAKELLGKRWKGMDPEHVVSSGRFTYDVLRKCHLLDMHAMLLMLEPVPIRDIQPMMRQELERRVDKLSVNGDGIRHEIDDFVKLFDVDRVKDCDWMERGAIKKGTQVILSSTPKAGLVVEAVTPGPLGRRKTTIVGMNKNPLLTASIFHCFVGHEAVDRQGGLQCLDGLVWCANGLSADTRTNPFSGVSEIDLDGRELFGPDTNVETISLSSTSIFQMDKTKKPKNLLLQFMKM